jgi:ClpP class serine protease
VAPRSDDPNLESSVSGVTTVSNFGNFLWQILWLFFMLSALQPLLQQRRLEAARQRRMLKFERKRGSRVIVMVHRQETMRLLGFPLVRYIDISDAEEVLRAIRMTDRDVPIDLVLHTPGGLVLAAVQIARALRQHPAKVTAFVPHYAMSGGTLLCLAANEIVMSPHAVLGPVDPQLGQMPAASLIKVVEQKPIAEIDDQTLVMADVGRKAIAQVRSVAHELLAGRLSSEQADSLSHKLPRGPGRTITQSPRPRPSRWALTSTRRFPWKSWNSCRSIRNRCARRPASIICLSHASARPVLAIRRLVRS